MKSEDDSPESPPKVPSKADLERVFGQTLPALGPDERSGAGGENDNWLRDNVPPHHAG